MSPRISLVTVLLAACSTLDPEEADPGRADTSTHHGECYLTVNKTEGQLEVMVLGDDGYFLSRIVRGSGCVPQSCGRWSVGADRKTFTFDTYAASADWNSNATESDLVTCKMTPPPKGQRWIDRWTRSPEPTDTDRDGKVDYDIYRWSPVGPSKASSTLTAQLFDDFDLFEACTVRPAR